MRKTKRGSRHGKNRRFIQAARERMERKGTVGAFGPATRSKISRAKAHGGLAKKRAVFAENMKRIAARHKRRGSSSRRS